MLKVDPTEGIASVKLLKTKGHHTWTEEEYWQYRTYWPLGTQQRLVMEFALETASRRGEVVKLGPQHVKKVLSELSGPTAAMIDIPISPELEAACNAMPKSHMTYILSAYGKPRSKYGLGNDFANGRPKQGYRHDAVSMASRRAGCAAARRPATPRTN